MDENTKKEVKELAESMAKDIVAGLGLEKIADLKETVDKLVAREKSTDSKLSKILNGKDYEKDADKLTKEEKIVGFFHALVTRNDHALKALSEGTADDGGNLIPQDFYAEIVASLQDKVVLRQLARIVPMKRNVLTIPTRTNSVKTYWTLENAAKTTTTANFGQSTLTAYKLAAILYASDELIEDSFAFDVVQMIIDMFSDSIAQEEEAAFAQGNGTTQPTGLTTARTDGTIASLTAAGQDFDDIINLEYSLKAQYRAGAVFLMNSHTEREMRKLKDTNGRYLWQEPVAVGQPATLHGKPAYNCEQLPDGHIYFGDFKRGYWIGDRGEIAVKVTQDSETAFTKDQTAIRVVKRTAGAVIDGTAIKALIGF